MAMDELHEQTGRFVGKVALVVGSAQGIGAATAWRLATEGARTVVADIKQDGASALAEAIGERAQAIYVDLRDEDSLRAMYAEIEARHGGLDCLVNNGYFGSQDDLDLETTPLSVWDQVFDVNLLGFVRSCRLALPLMRRRGGGAIVNLSSGAAIYAEKRRTAYGSSKAAVSAMTRGIAVQFGGEGIRANCVAPGTIGTETVLRNIGQNQALVDAIAAATPLARLGKPEELASVICFLLSDDASYLTGQTISVDGGRLAGAGAVAGAIPTVRN